MKKLVLICLLLHSIYSYEFSIYSDEESIQPSFECTKAKLHSVEHFLCYSNNTEIYPFSKGYNPYVDNFFNSYYNLIIQNIPKSEKPKARQIARDIMKDRDKAIIEINSQVEYYKTLRQEADNGDAESDNLLRYSAKEGVDTYVVAIFQIEKSYYNGMLYLTNYLLQYQPNLFNKIFYTNPLKYKQLLTQKLDDNVATGLLAETCNLAYKDGLINETGKLIVKVDSK